MPESGASLKGIFCDVAERAKQGYFENGASGQCTAIDAGAFSDKLSGHL
jgi:hypothetical protein